MISEPRPTSGFRQKAKEFVRIRLLALLDIPVLERGMAHDRGRLLQLDSSVHEARVVADAALLAAGGPEPAPEASVEASPPPAVASAAERAWREAAQPILDRHDAQTTATVMARRERYEAPVFGYVPVFELVERLGQCIDPTDCRLFGASQLTHVLLMIEAMDADGVLTPDLLLAALVHDLGKLLLLTDEDPANIVGMNAPIGEFPAGIGLDNVIVQWNHDEFGYSRLVDHVPDHIAWLTRYHSLDPSTVRHLADDRDRRYTEQYLDVFFHYDHDTKSAFRAPTSRLDDHREVIEAQFPKPIRF